MLDDMLLLAMLELPCIQSKTRQGGEEVDTISNCLRYQPLTWLWVSHRCSSSLMPLELSLKVISTSHSRFLDRTALHRSRNLRNS